MTGTYFETFLVGGLGLLVAAVLAIAWLLWRQDDTRREAIKLSLEGIGHEFRFNMFQTVRELADVSEGRITKAGDLPVLAHPQLDAVLAQTMATDKRALAAIQATYQSIEASKRRLRRSMSGENPDETALDAAKAAAIDGISTLYLWEDHEGRPPKHARSTRSWWVRGWMKAHGFEQDLLPGLALRDAVVENLRLNGMMLTPKPLTLTAHEYYSRRYDRKADPRGVFGARRKPKALIVEETDEAEANAAAGEAADGVANEPVAPAVLAAEPESFDRAQTAPERPAIFPAAPAAAAVATNGAGAAYDSSDMADRPSEAEATEADAGGENSAGNSRAQRGNGN